MDLQSEYSDLSGRGWSLVSRFVPKKDLEQAAPMEVGSSGQMAKAPWRAWVSYLHGKGLRQSSVTEGY